MSSRFDLIAQHLLHKPFSDCTIPELAAYTESHPYIAGGHFLLAKKHLVSGDGYTHPAVQKAALYYHDPSGFEAFLQAEPLVLEAMETDPGDMDEPDLPLQPFTGLHLPERAAKALPEESPIATPPVVTPETTEALAPTWKVIEKPAGELPAFEPFHTVDYFASQGIKLSQEEATKDKFGKQLRSFTEWLKTMKKLPAAEQETVTDQHAEQQVASMAAHSVTDPDILTETMAEVWLRQGNSEKAAEVYHKLSLLHPSKKVYFAAKLDSLKK